MQIQFDDKCPLSGHAYEQAVKYNSGITQVRYSCGTTAWFQDDGQQADQPLDSQSALCIGFVKVAVDRVIAKHPEIEEEIETEKGKLHTEKAEIDNG